MPNGSDKPSLSEDFRGASPRSRLRTAAALRDLFRAIAADAAALIRYSRGPPPSALASIAPWGISGLRTEDQPQFLLIRRPDEPQHSIAPYQGELIDLLQGVVEHGTGRGAALPGFAAGKMGTSQDFRDAWFIGFNDAPIVGVWVGNDDHSPMKSVTGGSIPALIWKRFMKEAGTTPTAMNQQPPAANEPANIANALGSTSFDALVDSAQCNIPVCELYYRSFRVSDCTYQPFWGARRYCER